MKPFGQPVIGWALVLLSAAALAACGGQPAGVTAAQEQDTVASKQSEPNWLFDGQPLGDGIDEQIVGHGTRAAVVFRTQKTDRTLAPLVYINGGSPLPPSTFSSFIRNSLAASRSFIFPAHNQLDRPITFENLQAAVHSGLEHLDPHPSPMILMGHGTGGALALRLAAAEAEANPQRPVLVVAVSPALSTLGPSARRLGGNSSLLILASTKKEEKSAFDFLRTLRYIEPRAKRVHLLHPGVNQRVPSEETLRREFWKPIWRFVEASS